MLNDEDRIVHCHNCLKEMKARDGVCPHCGFSMEKYWEELYQNQKGKKKSKIEDSAFSIIKRVLKTTFIIFLIGLVLAILCTYSTPVSKSTSVKEYHVKIIVTNNE